jgi:hypothetical protein
VSTEFEKYRGELYAKLTEEEKAFHDALVSIAEKYGPFDLGTSSIWVGYESGDDNEDAKIGVMCANCSFFNPETSGCAILSYKVEPTGKCRLAAIPDGYVMPEMDEEDEDEEEDVEDSMQSMDKADSVRSGQMVSWGSSGGRAEGKVKRIIRNGSYNVPDSDFTITGTPDNPAVVIEVYRDDKPTGRMVGHRMNTLSVKKSIWSSFSPREGFSKSNNVSLFAEKRDYSSSTRETMASRGQAMPDGSYPIANRTDLGNAIQAVGRAKNYDSVKQHIIRRARALGAMEMLPKEWK